MSEGVRERAPSGPPEPARLAALPPARGHRRVRRRALPVALLIALVAAPASAARDDFGDGAIVFARGASLWRTDPRGKGPAVEVMALPGAAADVRLLRSDAAGRVLLVDLAGTWWWARLGTTPATPAALPCADAPARLTRDGRIVVCADAQGRALLVGLVTGKVVRTRVPATGARVVVDRTRELIWVDGEGVWATPLADPETRRPVAPEPPLREFLAAPDGSRAVAIYPGPVFDKKTRVVAEVLDGFALDGRAARRMLHRDARVIDWSWDSRWVLVQAGPEACVTRATGGQYKCWKGFTALSLSPDGRWAVLAGARPTAGEAAGKPEPGRRPIEEADAGEDDDDADAPLPSGQGQPISIYRGRVEGTYTEKPALVEAIVDGAALWL
jgi:hypothetical protein